MQRSGFFMQFKQQAESYFDHFHAHPEVSFKEVETTKKLAEIMEELGVEYRTFDDVTGMFAEIARGRPLIRSTGARGSRSASRARRRRPRLPGA